MEKDKAGALRPQGLQPRILPFLGAEAGAVRPAAGFGAARTAGTPDRHRRIAGPAPLADRPLRIAVWYWGRRGGGARYTLETVRALARRPDVEIHLSLSTGNELLDEFRALELPCLPVDTYSDLLSAGLASCSLPRLRRRFRSWLEAHRIDAVLSTMPHLWTAAIADVVRKAGSRLVSTIHDASDHPGDWLPLSEWRLRRELRAADAVITLSRHVRASLVRRYGYPAAGIATIPHGLLRFSPQPAALRRFPAGRPFRFMFFGRILRYKGLDTLLTAYDRLRAAAGPVPPELWIAGAGDLRPYRERLDRLAGITLINRWIAEEEMPGLLDQADAMVLPYLEASQSGVVAAAHGAGIPVVVTPVGGLVEQVADGRTGLVARDTSPGAVCAAMAACLDPARYAALADAIPGECRAGLCADAQADRLIQVLGQAAADTGGWR